jgi:predicted transposase YbfD/YdcC
MPVSSSSFMTVVDDSDPVLGELSEVPAAPEGLWACLQQVVDPRKRRGVRHPITGIVALVLAATLAGAQSFVAIGEWVADAGDADLAGLGIGAVVPCESTIRRCLQRLDPGVLDVLVGAWMWLRTSHSEGRRIIALDGKSLRGARDAAGHLTHLLSALCQHTGTVLGQMTVGAKTNEIPVFTKLLDTMDIAEAVITADALHCQRGTAQYIVSRGAHYVLTVKDNQRNLRKQLKALPWTQIPVLSTDREHSHGRGATRRLKATEITAGIGFPGAVQVLQLTRKTRRRPVVPGCTPKWSTPSPHSHPATPTPTRSRTGCAGTGP